jgi:hypothetical protein
MNYDPRVVFTPFCEINHVANELKLQDPAVSLVSGNISHDLSWGLQITEIFVVSNMICEWKLFLISVEPFMWLSNPKLHFEKRIIPQFLAHVV